MSYWTNTNGNHYNFKTPLKYKHICVRTFCNQMGINNFNQRRNCTHINIRQSKPLKLEIIHTACLIHWYEFINKTNRDYKIIFGLHLIETLKTYLKDNENETTISGNSFFLILAAASKK